MPFSGKTAGRNSQLSPFCKVFSAMSRQPDGTPGCSSELEYEGGRVFNFFRSLAGCGSGKYSPTRAARVRACKKLVYQRCRPGRGLGQAARRISRCNELLLLDIDNAIGGRGAGDVKLETIPEPFA